MALRDTLRAITTPIEVNKGNSWSGTGFYFQRDLVDDKGTSKGIQVWLITNRHVLFGHAYDPNIKDELPDTLTFYLRCQSPSQGITWRPVVLNTATLATNSKLHTDPFVDITAIEVTNEIGAVIIANGKDKFAYAAVKDENIPQVNNYDVDVCDDAIAIGYPRGFYDTANLFPIIKSGIIATPWKTKFQGQPQFLVDIKLFPGSSGSLVITKPSEEVCINGKLTKFSDKVFAFIGVYSGEPYQKMHPIPIDDDLTIIRRPMYNVGIVWYSRLVPEIIDKGVKP